MESMNPEEKIYNLIKSKSDEKNCIFVLVNRYEVKILENNYIKIKNIKYHCFDRYGDSQSHDKIIEQYKSYDGEVYLLGTGPISEYYYDKTVIPNIYWERNFNCLKYLSLYSDEIISSIKRTKYDKFATDEEFEEYKLKENATFVETLKNEYKKSLFYCCNNIGIIGVEGYIDFHKDFYEYVESLEYIYIINGGYSEFTSWLIRSKYKDKVKHLSVYVAELFKSNPELIAYYRIVKDTYGRNYINKHYNLTYVNTRINDQIILGNDSYKHIKYYKESKEKYYVYFPEDEITHILNVSDEEIRINDIPGKSIIYENYAISEREKDNNISKATLFRAVDRLHELIQLDKKNVIYVHCSLGMNRSPSVILLYFIKYCGMTLYEAYKFISLKRQIFTSADLFKIIYEEALLLHPGDTISPLKLRTHYAYNFCEPGAYMFSLYDIFELEKITGCV